MQNIKNIKVFKNEEPKKESKKIIFENESFRGQIKAFRKKKDMNQHQMAKEIGVSYRYLQDLEEGKTKLLTDNMNKIMKYFGFKIFGPNGEIILQ